MNKLGKLGGIEAVVNSLKAFKDNAELCKFGCSALSVATVSKCKQEYSLKKTIQMKQISQ